MDFNPYEISVSRYFDGFIDPQGKYYIVKEKGQEEDLFNIWSKQFIEQITKVYYTEIKLNIKTILNLQKIDTFTDLLINLFGYIYYNHDQEFKKPIIKLPDPNICNISATSDQIEALYKIMQINNENPIDKEFIIDATINYYNGIEEDTERMIRWKLYK